MNSKMTTNSQLSTTEPKKKQRLKQTKQTTRTGTESQKWRIFVSFLSHTFFFYRWDLHTVKYCF